MSLLCVELCHSFQVLLCMSTYIIMSVCHFRCQLWRMILYSLCMATSAKSFWGQFCLYDCWDSLLYVTVPGILLLITTFHVVMIESFRVCCSWRQSPATPLLGTFRYMSLHCGWHFCVCYHWRLTVDGRTLHISWGQFLCGVTVDARYLTHK